MNSEKQKLRSEIRTEDKWNLEAMYPDFEAAIDDMSKAIARARELMTMQGHIMDSPKTLLDALLAFFKLLLSGVHKLLCPTCDFTFAVGPKVIAAIRESCDDDEIDNLANKCLGIG